MSREKKFTPGPWESVQNGWEYCYIKGLNPKGEVYSLANVSLFYDYSPHNANLIAAAPCLLEALEVCVELARIKYGNLDTDITKHFDKADSAIKKAYGETP